MRGMEWTPAASCSACVQLNEHLGNIYHGDAILSRSGIPRQKRPVLAFKELSDRQGGKPADRCVHWSVHSRTGSRGRGCREGTGHCWEGCSGTLLQQGGDPKEDRQGSSGAAGRAGNQHVQWRRASGWVSLAAPLFFKPSPPSISFSFLSPTSPLPPPHCFTSSQGSVVRVSSPARTLRAEPQPLPTPWRRRQLGTGSSVSSASISPPSWDHLSPNWLPALDWETSDLQGRQTP